MMGDCVNTRIAFFDEYTDHTSGRLFLFRLFVPTNDGNLRMYAVLILTFFFVASNAHGKPLKVKSRDTIFIHNHFYKTLGARYKFFKKLVGKPKMTLNSRRLSKNILFYITSFHNKGWFLCSKSLL